MFPERLCPGQKKKKSRIDRSNFATNGEPVSDVCVLFFFFSPLRAVSGRVNVRAASTAKRRSFENAGRLPNTSVAFPVTPVLCPRNATNRHESTGPRTTSCTAQIIDGRESRVRVYRHDSPVRRSSRATECATTDHCGDPNGERRTIITGARGIPLHVTRSKAAFLIFSRLPAAPRLLLFHKNVPGGRVGTGGPTITVSVGYGRVFMRIFFFFF